MLNIKHGNPSIKMSPADLKDGEVAAITQWPEHPEFVGNLIQKRCVNQFTHAFQIIMIGVPSEISYFEPKQYNTCVIDLVDKLVYYTKTTE